MLRIARKRLEERGSAYKALRLAVWDYHQKARCLGAKSLWELETPNCEVFFLLMVYDLG